MQKDGATLTTYTYSNANRLSLRLSSGAAVGVTTHSFAPAGNRLSQVSSVPGAESLYYSWDAPGKLIFTEVPAGIVTITVQSNCGLGRFHGREYDDQWERTACPP